MRTNKIVLGILMVVLSCWMGLVSFTWAGVNQSDPVGMLENIANRMIAALKIKKATIQTHPQYVYSLADKLVVPYADLTETSRRVLPPPVWNSASPAQKAQFKREFTTLLLRTYASALASYSDQTVQFYPIRGGYAGQSTVEVSSDISGDGPSIHVVYRLIRVDNVWRLYDMSVEGVSLIESFRAQFADILSQGNMDLLLKRLSQHNLRMSAQT